MSDEEIHRKIKEGEFSNIVAVYDNKTGCPEMRDKDGYYERCNLGIYKCAVHGQFPVKYRD